MDKVPFSEIIRVGIPAHIFKNKAILTLIKHQNVELGTEDWAIIQGRTRDKGESNYLCIRSPSTSTSLTRHH